MVWNDTTTIIVLIYSHSEQTSTKYTSFVIRSTMKIINDTHSTLTRMYIKLRRHCHSIIRTTHTHAHMTMLFSPCVSVGLNKILSCAYFKHFMTKKDSGQIKISCKHTSFDLMPLMWFNWGAFCRMHLVSVYVCVECVCQPAFAHSTIWPTNEGILLLAKLHAHAYAIREI